ncbi:MAG TPA: discoidin domain-containing protein [Gemmataceae bacterium]|nr:discoidin domain-containing protein [Gemmataceae bacterium]
MSRSSSVLATLLFITAFTRSETPGAAAPGTASASSVKEGSGAAGALDGDRFSAAPGACWKGRPGERCWYWQIRFAEPRSVGAILQVVGDAENFFRNAPSSYVWQESLDGTVWREIPETNVARERRTFRLHRLKHARRAQYLRLLVRKVDGDCPTLREVEFYAEPDAAVAFPEWCVSVNTLDDRLPGGGQNFLKMVRQVKGGDRLQAQEIKLGEFNESFLAAEPRPLCVFMSGNVTDWCQKDREDWRGAQEVLKNGRVPMWAACGGAQGLAILSEYGVDKPWDCPHCRDPKNPLTPIYTHIRDRERRPCGDYSQCVREEGPTNVLQTAADPVFDGLPREFSIVQNHCGQIEWAPRGWVLVATRGAGGKTRTQCLRVKDRYIYAAQFHFEAPGTLATSRVIMTNFLKLAREWGGYNPDAKPVPPPRSYAGLPGASGSRR